MNDQQQAAEALASVRAHQERTRRAARLPWWVYAAMFLLSAGVTAVNDFTGLGGAKLVAALVLVALVIALVAVFAGRAAPLSRFRGVQGRQSFVPSVFVLMAIVMGAGTWLASRYGAEAGDAVARALGLEDYPNTVTGVLYGAAFTLLFALSQALVAASQRRTTR